MTTTELIQAVRDRLDDAISADYLFSDARLLRALDNAQREACERAHLIYDATTASVCEVSVVAGTHTYALDPSITKVMRAKLSAETLPLKQITQRDLDLSVSDWESLDGTPRWFYQYGNNIRLAYNPEANDTLYLEVYRRPLVVIDELTDALEIPSEYHQGLVHGVCAEVYGDQDADTYDPQREARESAIFDGWFGPKPSANQMRMRKEVPNNLTARPRRF